MNGMEPTGRCVAGLAEIGKRAGPGNGRVRDEMALENREGEYDSRMNGLNICGHDGVADYRR